jgi:molybdate transport system regulatory protein
MHTSARNQLKGTVTKITPGAINDEVEITLPCGTSLVSTITHSSVNTLGLAQGGEALAFIKAPWVILAAADSGLRFSARNQFVGSVVSVVEGAINSEVTVKVNDELTLVSVITNESVHGMKLNSGDKVIALVKASSIIIATYA